MAEGGSNAATSSGWWGNLVSVAKNKSVEVLEFMKKDFDEISSAIRTEASTIASSTASAVKETLQLDKEESAASSVKRSVSTLFGSFKEALSPSPSTEFDEALVIHDGNPVAMTKLQKKIHKLVSDDATFVEEIGVDERPQFEAWLGVVEETLNSVDRLTHLLSVNPTLQTKYTDLVPEKVSHTDFWQRYLFKKAVLEDKEAEIDRREERDRKTAEEYPWEREDSLAVGGGAELSEEEQTRLLVEYEREKLEGEKGPGRPAAKADNQDASSEKEGLTVKERKDMVIVSTTGATDISQASSSSKASTDGDWEKEFDLEESSPENQAASSGDKESSK